MIPDRFLDENLPTRLKRRLRGNLPGAVAQRRLAPNLTYGRHLGPPTADARSAAVVVLLFRAEGQWRIPLTVRPKTMKSHPGQVSLPGGMVEPGETRQDAALRELHEELGVASQYVEVLGRLSPLYVFVTNFLVTPFVAWAASPPQFQPHAEEVDRIIEADLHSLLSPTRQVERLIRRDDVAFTVPCFRFADTAVWGATSMILSELAAVVNSL